MSPTVTGRSIRFRGVSKMFAAPGSLGVTALKALDLVVPAQQFVAIVGPSGCGKSTLLRLVDGLLKPDQGAIDIAGRPPIPGPDIGLVFQNFRLIPWRTVADNVAFPLHGLTMDSRERGQRVARQLAQVGLTQWAQSYPAQLSGGMRQRVALARALVGQPDVLLMDEPFASLDAQTRELMQDDLLSLWEQQCPTVMFVTHSVDEALLLADRVLIMGKGAVLEDISVGLPRPRDASTVRLMPEYGILRERLWALIRDLVLADPASPFYGRDHRA